MLSCVAAPKQSDSIADARLAIRAAENMPLAGEVAAQEIDAAHTALREAETLANKHRPARDISNAAYIAKRHAEIAEQQITIAQAKKTVEAADHERQRVLLAARADEAPRNAVAADTASRHAESATREAETANREAGEAQRRAD
jgi:hypothetical protein